MQKNTRVTSTGGATKPVCLQAFYPAQTNKINTHTTYSGLNPTPYQAWLERIAALLAAIETGGHDA